MAHQADHDRVVMVSRKADGSPDQTSDFTIIGDKQFAKDAATEQLTQQRVSAADVAIRGVGGAGSAAGSGAPDKAVQKIIDAHEKAASNAEKDAHAEVDERFEDVAGDARDRETAARRSSGTETTATRAPERAPERAANR